MQIYFFNVYVYIKWPIFKKYSFLMCIMPQIEKIINNYKLCANIIIDKTSY